MFIKPHSYSDDYSNRSFPLSKKCKYLSNHLPLILGYSTTLASLGNSFSIFHSTHTSLYISNSSRHWGNSTEQCTLKSLPCGCHSGGERNNTANSSVQSLSRVRLFATPWIAAGQASLSITNSRSLCKLMPIESVIPSSHLILCHSLFLLPPFPPSIRVFSNESTLHIRWPKY